MGIQVRVAAVDSNPAVSAACQMADVCCAVPRCTAPDFIPSLLEVCLQEKVRLLVPTIDTELLTLAEHRAEFRAIGTRVVVSSPELVRLARNKVETARFLAGRGLPVPRTALLSDLLAAPDAWRWPAILKPVGGSSSVGIVRAENLAEAQAVAAGHDDYLAQELWVGREYTVNVFFDQAGTLRAAVPHWRYEVRAGEVSKGITERQPVLLEIAERLGQVLRGACGPLCFQAIVNERGEAAVFEINARFGGGYPLAHRAGARFTQWLLEEVAGLPSTANDDWEEGVVMLRYDAAVFCKQANEKDQKHEGEVSGH